MNYDKKYLKYKLKYINLKNQIGGNKLIETHIPELLSNPNIDSVKLKKINSYLLIESNIDIIKKHKDLINKYDGSLELIKLLCSDKYHSLAMVPELFDITDSNLDLILNSSKLLNNYLLTDQILNIRNNDWFSKYDVICDKSIYNNKTFKIDPELKEQWISSQCTNNAKILGRFILDITKHVDYNEFHKKLLESIKKIPTDKKYIIYIPGEYSQKKSNEWILAILIDKINKLGLDIKIFDIVYYTDHNYFEKISFYLLFRKYLNFLICDDGSYSGKQLSDTVKIELSSLYKANQIVYCLVPYISTCALARLKSINIIPLYSDKIETIKERCDKLNITQIILDSDIINIETDLNKLQVLLNYHFPNLPTNNAYDLDCGAMPFYFDHKIADNVSTLPIIYNLGYIHHNFIDKCTHNQDTQYKKNILLFNNCDINPVLKSLSLKELDQQCIIPYYKQLDIEIQKLK